MSEVFDPRGGGGRARIDPQPFPALLSELCEELTHVVKGETSALFLYDEVADGFSVGAVHGTGLRSLLGKAAPASEVEPLVQVLERGTPVLIDRPDGWVRRETDVARTLAAGPRALIPLDDGTSVGVFVVTASEVVTGQVMADDVMRAAREVAAAIPLARPDRGHDCLFRRMLESDPGGVAVVEGEGWIFSYASPVFRQIHNLVDEPFIGRKVAETLSARHADTLLQLLEQVEETGESRYASEVEILDEYGPRVYDVHVLPQRATRGVIPAVLIIFWARTDTYVTRRALQATILRLAESESLLAAVLNASNSGIAFVSTERIVAYANKQVAEFFGLEVEQLVGRNAHEMVTRSMMQVVRDAHGFADRLRALYDDMEQTSVEEIEVERPTFRILERYSAPVYSDDATLLGRIEVYNDVTEVRELQRNKDEFLSLISHELRTPVTSVKGFAQLLRRRARREQPSPQTLLAYETIERQSQRMQDLIDLLLDLTRIESGRLNLEIRDVDLTMLAGRVAEMLQITAENHAIELRLPARPVRVRGDEHRLEQVLVNLVTNAVLYSPAGGTVTVAVENTQDQARVTVTDCGVGIPADMLDRVFERFYRVNGGPDSRGLGLGLYITKEIIERHGGSVFVESEVGVGSKFTVLLPVAGMPTGAESKSTN